MKNALNHKHPNHSSSTIDRLDSVADHEVLGLGHFDQEAGQFPAESDADSTTGADRNELHVAGDLFVDLARAWTA